MATGWSREELFIAVDYYIRMLNEERLGNQYSKIEYLRSAHELIPERTIKSIEMRMQNISAVLDANGELWIEGFKPLRNIEFIHPWKIDDDDLEVVSYTYKWK